MRYKYITSIYEVTKADITIGFMARRSVVVGIAQEIPDGWMITRSVIQPLWSGNHSTRKEARAALEKLNK